MPATVTLASATLASPITATDRLIKVDTTAGMVSGTRLFIPGPDRELMTVVGLGPDPWVNVIRGVDGTCASPHVSGATLIVGRPDQFYSSDPVGRPEGSVLVSPYCNVLTGDLWYAQGDSSAAAGEANRWWQKATTVYDVGPLGVRTVTQSPTSST
jgi:hypothetical protein